MFYFTADLNERNIRIIYECDEIIDLYQTMYVTSQLHSYDGYPASDHRLFLHNNTDLL